MTLQIFGDSLLDGGNGGGNLTAILAALGLPSPFAAPPYSDGKASNGLVFGEAVAEELGIDSDTLISRFTVPTSPDVREENIVYAVAGATSEDLLSQVELFLADFEAASEIDDNGDEDDEDDDQDCHDDEGNRIDAIIGAGSNDVLVYLDPINAPDKFNVLLSVLSTEEEDDDLDLTDQIATYIEDNIDRAYDLLEDSVDRTVITALSPLGDIPLAIQADQLIDSLLPEDQSGGTRDFLTGVAEEVNDRLMHQFDDEENILILDAFGIFEEGLEAWKLSVEAMGLKPITNLDFISSGPGADIDQFAFLDPVHPTESFNEFLAMEASTEIVSEFANFGMA